jgi:DNA-binding response OmpR family regulator
VASLSQILVADDDPGIVQLLKVLIEREGFSVDVARDGREALEKIERGSYVLILLDLQMPYVNGFDVLDKLRVRSRRPVVLVVTALPPSQLVLLDPDVVHAVIRKPFDVELVAAVISVAAGMMVRPSDFFRGNDRPQLRP